MTLEQTNTKILQHLKIILFIIRSGRFLKTFYLFFASDWSKTFLSRFVTVHGTHNAQVRGNTGYITRGHGYFIEDGNEKGTVFDGNLGMVAHQGIILPTDKGTPLCQNATEGTGSNCRRTVKNRKRTPFACDQIL